VYESINDILIGINESKMLRWLIRNRQEKGIEKRYQIEQTKPPAPPVPSTSTAPSTMTAPATTTASPQSGVTPPVTSSQAVTTTGGPPPQ